MKRILHCLKIFGYKRWQTFFEKLDYICLVGMNIGRGGDASTSGELRVIEYVKSKSSQPIVIFDIGSNFGEYLKMLLLAFKEKRLIYAFEPSAKVFQVLKENMGSVSDVRLHNFGFSDVAESRYLFSSENESGLGSVYKRQLEHFGTKNNDSRQTIYLETIDTFCKKNNIQNIDFLKIDVEGHELKVLKGAQMMLRNKAIKFIQFEFGGADIDSKTFFQDFYYLLKDDFNIYRIVKDGLYPIRDYKESYERFMNTNFFAERK